MMKESKDFNIVYVMTATTLRTMTRINAGKELSRNEAFLIATKAYFNGNFPTEYFMLKLPCPGALRDFLVWPLYKYNQYYRQQRMIEMIKPVVVRRVENHQLGNKCQ